jgi:hypothetical protein
LSAKEGRCDRFVGTTFFVHASPLEIPQKAYGREDMRPEGSKH